MKQFFALLLVTLSFQTARASDDAVVQWKKGDDKVQLQRSPEGKWIVKGGSADGRRIVAKDAGYALETSKGVVEKSARAKDSSYEIVSDKGEVIHVLKFEGEQGRLFKGDQLEGRFKVKDSKINFYDAQAKRVARGKPKDDGVSIKLESSTATETKLKGTKSLREAGILGLPLDDGEKLLLFSLERKL